MGSLDRRETANKPFRFRVSMVLILWGSWIFLAPSMGSSDSEQLWLRPDAVFERTIAGAETHRYRVHLQADQSLRVIVEQQGIDLELLFFDPEGFLISDYDSPTYDGGNEYGLLVSQTENEFTLEVRSLFEKSSPGGYRLWVEYLGPSSERDQNLYGGLLLDHQTQELSPHLLAHGDRILELKRRALDFYRAANHARAILYCRFQLATFLKDLGDLEQALDLLRQLLEEMGEPARAEALRVEETWAHLDWLSEPNLSIQLHETIGWIYFDRGSPERALWYLEAAARVREASERWRIEAIQGLGRIHLAMGNADRALVEFEKVLAYWEMQGHEQRVSLILQEIGQAHEAEGRLSRALEIYEQSLELPRSSAFRGSEIPIALTSIGRMELAVGNEVMALDRFEQALRHLRDIRRDPSAVLFEIAGLHRDGDRRQPALKLYRQALDEAREHGNRQLQQSISYQIADLLRAESHPDEALEWVRSATEMAESERSSTLNPNLTNPLLASSQPLYDLQVELLMALHQRDPQMGHDIEAFETSERSRARSLLEVLPRSKSLEAEAKWLRERRLIERNLDALTEKQSRTHGGRLPPWDEAPMDRAAHLDLLNRHAEVEAKIRARPVDSDSAVRAEPLGLREIQDVVLDAETLLLEYDLGERSSWVWAVTTDRLISVELPPRAEIEAAAGHLYKVMTTRSERRDFETDEALRRRIAKADAEYPFAAARLSQLLLAPIAELLDRRRLVIVGDGILQAIPFAILTRPGASGPPDPLITRHEIVGAPSASVLASLRATRLDRASNDRILTILADPVFEAGDSRLANLRSVDPGAMAALSPEALPDLGLSRLPATGEEARRIASRLPADETLVALGFEASRELALRGGLASSRILHFASHATIASDYPELSRIVLARFDAAGQPVNGFLTVADIRRLELSADLVVLSACRTALGKAVRGEGLLGLHRSFMVAGASAVLASVWSPQDRATAELMGRFYQGLLEEGLDPAAALRRAQLSLWREEYAPYYWGGFVLQGDWRALSIKDSAARRALSSVRSSNGG